MKRAFTVLISAVGLMAISIAGCGSSSPSGNVEKEATTPGSSVSSPSMIVEQFYQAILDEDCQKVAGLVKDDDSQLGLVDNYVEDCRQGADKLVSFRIIEEEIDEIGLFARVVTEVTFMEGGQQKTNTATTFLVRTGDEWKLTEIP